MTHQTFTLRRGESRLLRAAAGSRWRVTRGSVRIAESPRWLGERIVQIDTTLRDGQTLAVDVGGWIALRALADSVIEHRVHLSTWALWPKRWRIIRSARAQRAAA